MRNIFVCILIFWVFVSMAYSEIIYKWVDKDGVVNFTDDPTNIPSQYRNRVERGGKGDPQEVEAPHMALCPLRRAKGEGRISMVWGKILGGLRSNHGRTS